MNKYKRGYTIIEVMVVIAIVLIIGGMTLSLITETIENYFTNINRCYYEDKFDNALLNIDVICNSNGITSIEGNVNFTEQITKDIKSDNIVVTFKEKDEKVKVKIIYLKESRLFVRTLTYEDYEVSVGNNVLIDNVEQFTVNKKENLIYYSIKTKKSGERIRCI